MGKTPGFTTTADMPADVQELFELTARLEGGPTFDLPNFRQLGIDFSRLTIHQAETLVARKWPGIRRKQAAEQKTPAPAQAPVAEEAKPLPQQKANPKD